MRENGSMLEAHVQGGSGQVELVEIKTKT